MIIQREEETVSRKKLTRGSGGLLIISLFLELGTTDIGVLTL